MKFMDRLPTVISCCFCCFLRAGTVMIAVVSFVFGAIFAPNVNHIKGFWDMGIVLSNYSATTEAAVHIILGCASIMLCIVSFLLLIGALCNVPQLIGIYQWGAVVYSSIISVMFLVLAMFCFFVHSNSILTGCALIALIVINVLLTMYFIIVANSLRVSLEYLNGSVTI